MEERNKMSDIHRIIMNYWKMTTTGDFSNEEDEKSYTQGVLDEINEIVNLLPIHDVSDSEKITISKNEYEWLKKCEKDLNSIDFSL